MSQNAAFSEKKLVFINGALIEGCHKVNETGTDEDAIEVPEPGRSAQIGSGQEKIAILELDYIVKRSSPTYKYFKTWHDGGKEARDLVIYTTDKSGKIDNTVFKQFFPDCEMLGTPKYQDFDQASGKFSSIKIRLAPYRYSDSII